MACKLGCGLFLSQQIIILLIFFGVEYQLGHRPVSAPVADAIFFLLFFFYCTCNKFIKVKVKVIPSK